MDYRFLRLLSVCLPLLMAVVPVWGQDGSGDGSTKETGLSIDIREMPLPEVLTQLQQLSGCSFLYDSDIVEKLPKITLKMENAALTDILDRIVAITKLDYTRVDNTFTFGSGEARTETAVTGPGASHGRLSGKVVDGNGEPLAGATVLLVGSGNAYSLTDLDGCWSINASAPARISVSYLGFVTKEVRIDSDSPVTVQLQEDMNMLDEIVVVGYGTMEKKAVTSSITSISAKDILAGQGGSTIATALKGQISGMTITETSSPNTSSSMQLRGVASINAAASPLVVVDGVPGADIRSINFEDVLSIDVLKDASAGAIYGTRAAAGVILITTKKPNEGPMRLSYTAELSTEQVSNRPQLLTRDEFLRFGLGSDLGSDNDWYGALLNEGAFSHRHVVNLSGGGHTARVYATFVASDQKGIALGDNRKDYSGRINGSFNLLDDLLEINIHTEYREAHRDQRASNSNFAAAMKMNPTEPIYDEDNPSGYNVIIGGDYYFNPVADVMLKQRDKIDKWMLADANVKLNLPLGFSAQATVSWQDRQMQATYYTSSQHRSSIENGRNGEGYHEFNKTINVSIEPTINFDRVFANDHTVNAVLGYSFYEENSESFNMTNYNFPVDGTGAWDMSAGDWLKDGRASMDSYKYPRTRLIAFFGRVNYSYKSRYMVTASLRHEGSSKFGKDHRWGDFWAVSGGWRISSEPWMDGIGWIDDLKIRAGYGVTGNCGFGAGQTAFRYASGSYWPMNGDWIMSYGPANNVNSDLHWEEKSELNIGLDYAFLGNRLYGKFDWYHRWVDGMIYDITVTTPPAMYDSTVMNYGNLENWGWEFEVGGIPVRTKNFEWTSAMRFSQNKSKITSLWGNHSYQDRVNFPAPGAPGTGGRLEEGTVIGSYYLWKYAGITEDGKWLIYDKNNDIILADNKTYDDKRYIGNAIPQLIFSWDNIFRYRNLSLGINLRAWLDYDVFNTIDMYYGLANVSNQNVLRSAFLKNEGIKQEKLLCDYWLEDGSFLKIDAISLGYTINMKKWQKYIDAIDLYLTVRNVACLTGYSGLNPEVNINGLDPGYEWYNDLYPETRRYTFGVKLTF